MGLKARLFSYYFPEIVSASSIRNIPTSHGIVLMYHEVCPDDFIMPAWTVVKESDFRWQMDYLQTHFDVVSIEQGLVRTTGRLNNKRPFAVVTFDDGYKGNLETVLPIMKSMGLPFTVYVATEAIIDGSLYWYDQIISLLNIPQDVRINLEFDNAKKRFNIRCREGDEQRWREVQRLLTFLKQMAPVDRDKSVKKLTDEFKVVDPLEMLSQEDLKRLANSDCVTVGSHTHGHELLDQLTTEEIRETIQAAHRHIYRITGYVPRHFSYPNGNFNQCVKDLVEQAGYETAVTTLQGIWSDVVSCMDIPRFGIGRFESKGQFKARISGFL